MSSSNSLRVSARGGILVNLKNITGTVNRKNTLIIEIDQQQLIKQVMEFIGDDVSDDVELIRLECKQINRFYEPKLKHVAKRVGWNETGGL